MKIVFWLIIALVLAFAAFYFPVRLAQRRLPAIVLPPGESMPATALQRLARRTLVVVLILTLAAVAVVALNGFEAWWNVDAVRLPATGLLVAALLVFAYYTSRIWSWTARDDGSLDERDRAIAGASAAGQGPAMLVTLAVWMIGLVETHQSTDMIPSGYLYLVFWSCLIVGVIAQLAGVVIGYRRS